MRKDFVLSGWIWMVKAAVLLAVMGAFGVALSLLLVRAAMAPWRGVLLPCALAVLLVTFYHLVRQAWIHWRAPRAMTIYGDGMVEFRSQAGIQRAELVDLLSAFLRDGVTLELAQTSLQLTLCGPTLDFLATVRALNPHFDIRDERLRRLLDKQAARSEIG